MYVLERKSVVSTKFWVFGVEVLVFLRLLVWGSFWSRFMSVAEVEHILRER